MPDYKHLTGRDRAEQEWVLGDVAVEAGEHPRRPDFVDDSILVDVSDFVNSGLPVQEDGTDAEKADQVTINP